MYQPPKECGFNIITSDKLTIREGLSGREVGNWNMGMKQQDGTGMKDWTNGWEVVRIQCTECSKAPYVSMLDQGFTAGRQYREPWLDSDRCCFKGQVGKITGLVMHLIYNNFIQR